MTVRPQPQTSAAQSSAAVETGGNRRPAAETRAEILRVALDLFTRRGFEGTSIRDLSEALGMTKSSLYYHFAGKEAILRALLSDRRAEIEDMLAWIDVQRRDRGLLQRAALRWVDSTSPQRLQGMRFAHANRPVMARLAAEDGGLRSWFDDLIGHVLPADAPVSEFLRARMAFDTVSAALFAALGTDATDQDILSAARQATISLTS